jgi:hypothetical protein
MGLMRMILLSGTIKSAEQEREEYEYFFRLADAVII